MNQIIDQIVQFLQQGIAWIFNFFKLIWTWSFGQMIAIFQSDWQSLPLWKILVLAAVVIGIIYVLYKAVLQLWDAAEKILKGDPEQSVRNHYGSPCGQFQVGIWEGAVGQWTFNYTEHEYCEILQGVSVIRDQDGNAKTVRAGDRFVIPAGLKGTWEVLEPCRKVYVMFESKA